MVSRRAVEDAGILGEPGESAAAFVAVFEGVDDLSMELAGAAALGLAGTFVLAGGFAKTSCTDGRGLEGRAAKVLLPLIWLILGLPITVLANL